MQNVFLDNINNDKISSRFQMMDDFQERCSVNYHWSNVVQIMRTASDFQDSCARYVSTPANAATCSKKSGTKTCGSSKGGGCYTPFSKEGITGGTATADDFVTWCDGTYKTSTPKLDCSYVVTISSGACTGTGQSGLTSPGDYSCVMAGGVPDSGASEDNAGYPWSMASQGTCPDSDTSVLDNNVATSSQSTANTDSTGLITTTTVTLKANNLECRRCNYCGPASCVLAVTTVQEVLANVSGWIA